MKKFIGIEIGGTKLQVFLGDENMEIIKRSRMDVGESKNADNIRGKISDVLDECLEYENICGIGVGFGGPVNYNTGSIATSHQVKGWSGFNIKEWLEGISKLPVRVENDANTAALGEALYGNGKNYDKVFYVTLGSGVGGGYVINREIYHGLEPGESEIGQMRYDKSGTTFESVCSGWAVDNRIREYTTVNPGSKLAGIIGNQSSSEAKFLVRAIEEDDSGAKDILERIAVDLAFGLSHVVHLFHPEVIILGGGLSLMGELLRESVASALPQFIMKAFYSSLPDIRLAGLGEDVVCFGALLLAQKITA